MINWYFGWFSILAAFFTGVILGLFFYCEDFLGGYASLRRRLLRLGHIAMAALGMINILYGLSHADPESSAATWIAAVGFILGGITMPGVCFLTSWRVGFRHLFFVPVCALVTAVVATLWIGLP